MVRASHLCGIFCSEPQRLQKHSQFLKHSLQNLKSTQDMKKQRRKERRSRFCLSGDRLFVRHGRLFAVILFAVHKVVVFTLDSLLARRFRFHFSRGR